MTEDVLTAQGLARVIQQLSARPRIWAYCLSMDRFENLYMTVMAEDGEVLGFQVCQKLEDAQFELHDHEVRKAICEKKYPYGYEFIILPPGEMPPADVMDRYAESWGRLDG